MTPDYINPRHPWPHLEALAGTLRAAPASRLRPRAPIYDRYVDARLARSAAARGDARGAGALRGSSRWTALAPTRARGGARERRRLVAALLRRRRRRRARDPRALPRRRRARRSPTRCVLCARQRRRAARARRRRRRAAPRAGRATRSRYVVNRNINFTNVCVKACRFCAFSRTQRSEEGYFLDVEEIVRRARRGAATLGATEVCIQAGLRAAARRALLRRSGARASRRPRPTLHLHAFSPEEVKYGAELRGLLDRASTCAELKDAGLGSLPGTSAEMLDDERAPAASRRRRITTAEWIDVITQRARARAADHVDDHVRPRRDRRASACATSICCARSSRRRGGFTEFVPLSFVHAEAPMHVKQHAARRAPGPHRQRRDRACIAHRAADARPELPQPAGLVGQGRACAWRSGCCRAAPTISAAR